MRTLFLKIFVWFWAAMALVGLALVVSTLTTTDTSASRWKEATGTAVTIYAETAAEMYERQGSSAVIVYLQRVERTARMRTRLFNTEGKEVCGRETHDKDLALAERAKGSDEPVFQFTDEPQPMTRIAHRVSTPGGATVILVGEMPRRRFTSYLPEPGALALRLFAMLLTAGLVCYALARYLAAPIENLRAGVRRLAGGDLTTRVSARLGGRRDEIADLSRDFDRMAERIESLVASQQQLLGDISHELRSPLARLNVALGIARQRASDEAEPVRKAFDRIEREAERLNDLIGQLLTLTRLENSAEPFERATINLHETLAEIVADADYEAQSRNRRVELKESAECRIEGDEELLRRAIENVVRNAVRYTADGTTVEVTLRCTEGNGRRAQISVRDHGPGVPEEALEKLFRPFYRVADSRERRTGGTGLGLAIARRSVLLHGGAIGAKNAADGGLVVDIEL